MESSASQTTDLRTFLKILDDRWPGEILRVDTEGKTFDLADCDAAGFLFNLKTAGKRPDSAVARIRLEDFVSAAELGKISG
jgi:hypothetical protein